ncbi:Crp/Fnr family transcriptional regulator [Kallotenue papyrolyticum]|uniref:Crp/Fnr family transcriptional regulator n=1 Tax=Kallotenue papyrolyticum TaxID=1325125 RepID=UPI0004785304|nr:Crp/Fnr family transcriptional regulator [Kallotenue papyrolyticum]
MAGLQVPERRWDELERRGLIRRFVKGGTIYMPDEPAVELYLIKEGRVALNLLSSEGRTLTVRAVKNGELFGHAALLSDGAYDTFAQALRPTTVAAIRRDELEALMAERPALALALMDDLGRHSQALSRRLETVAFKSVPARLAALLLELAQPGRGGEPATTGRWTHQELADMINAYRETTTKVLNQFRAAQLIDVDRKGVRLLDVTRLREVAQH